MRNDLLVMQKKVERELGGLVKAYDGFYSEIQKRFRDEYQTTGTMIGLEDFSRFGSVVKHNKTIVQNIFTTLSRLKNIEDFDISEETRTETDKRSNPK